MPVCIKGYPDPYGLLVFVNHIRIIWDTTIHTFIAIYDDACLKNAYFPKLVNETSNNEYQYQPF